MRFNNFWVYRRVLLSRRFFSSLWRSRQNIISNRYGVRLSSGPYMAELDVTYRCDCSCRMCRRWQDHRHGEMTLEEYERLSREFMRMGVHLVSIAGGEPFLRPDIFAIIRSFTRYGMAVNVSTNGLLLERHSEEIARCGLACLTVSVDGATARTHEKVRGAPGSYEKIERGILSLLSRPAPKRPVLRVRMTLCKENTGEVGAFYKKWHRLADDVLLQPVHQCPDAFYAGPDPDLFRLDPDLLARELERTPFKKRGGYMHELLRSLRNGNAFPAHRCYAGVLMVRIDPWGNVYPCLEQHVRVGSVRGEEFQKIWDSEALYGARKSLAENGHCRCWYNNTALISHYARIVGRVRARPLAEGVNKFLEPKSWTTFLLPLARIRGLSRTFEKPVRPSVPIRPSNAYGGDGPPAPLAGRS